MLTHHHQCMAKPCDWPSLYKEGGSSMKFEPFDGALDKLTALNFFQRFDTAYQGGTFSGSIKDKKSYVNI